MVVVNSELATNGVLRGLWYELLAAHVITIGVALVVALGGDGDSALSILKLGLCAIGACYLPIVLVSLFRNWRAYAKLEQQHRYEVYLLTENDN